MTHGSHLLLVLMKIRLGNTNKDLVYHFRISYGMVSKMYRSWLVILSKALQPLIVWPSRGALRQHLPSAFKSYKNCACIIDCTEIFIQRPLNFEARAIAWSNYKHTNTLRYLIRVSPAGAVTFLSHGWGGQISHKQLSWQLSQASLTCWTLETQFFQTRDFLPRKRWQQGGLFLQYHPLLEGKYKCRLKT